jgi:hypothetical protein
MTKVAVIGAGAAGLVTADELRRAGHEIVVFERSSQIGGVWVYAETTDRSMYASLRTNLPRDLMAFRSFPFDSRGSGDDEGQRFPSHRAVLDYLLQFALDRDLFGSIEFETEVTGVNEAPNGWTLETSRRGEVVHHEFEAVAVCNGHFSVPRPIEIEGAAAFPGWVKHSREYRRPDPYQGMSVAVVGAGSSGLDLSVEIAAVAERVYWCGKDFDKIRDFPGMANLSTAPMPDALTAEGDLSTAGVELAIDGVLLCTGFNYDLPFIDEGVVAGRDAPAPLYQHMLPIGHPTMALIGIPQRIIPFPLFEMQAAWFAAVLSGDVILANVDEMWSWLEAWHEQCRRDGRDGHQFRNIGEEQFDYIDELARECGAALLPDWYRPLAQETQQNRLANPLDYRDRPLAIRGDSQIVP